MKERHRDGIGEAVEDDFIYHVAARADGVPEQTQHRDPDSLPRRRTLLHRGHLSAQSRESTRPATLEESLEEESRDAARPRPHRNHHGDQLREFRFRRKVCCLCSDRVHVIT